MTDRVYLDWPDSPGLWWCSVRTETFVVERVGGELQVFDNYWGFSESDWKPNDYVWCCRKDWQGRHKATQFTKVVLEPNPFQP